MRTRVVAAALAAFALSFPAVCTAQEPGQQAAGGRAGFQGMQRVSGEITAVNGDTITVKTEDGSTAKIATTTNTRIMKGQGGMPAKAADLKPGDGVMGAGNMDEANKTLHAVFVVATDAETLKKLRENLGKTYISGKVTAVDADNATMTVLRTDNVSQTIGFDETTSFRRGRGGRGGAAGMLGGGMPAGGQAGGQPSGESITLADVKVGDQIVGQGAVKKGVFVPSQLMVSTPGERRQRPAGAPPTAPQP
jgi:hypothetical protein